MNTIKQKIKFKLLKFIEIFPFGRDIYLHLSAARLGISYRGVYSSYPEALLDIPSSTVMEYDVINENKLDNKEHEKTTLDNWFHDIDYPLLFWLSRIVGGEGVVLELGGSVGHFFFTSDAYINYPDDLRWTIAELPQAVELGRQLVEEREESRLKFIDSANLCDSEPADIFMTAGTLQYMKMHVVDIIGSLAKAPKHVLIHNLPVHDDTSIWTLQNLGVCELPYRIYSSEDLKSRMLGMGYEQVATWTSPRGIEIPFNREFKILGYLGFYFRRV